MIFIKKNNSNTRNDFWIGFSDLMTGLMLVFIVLALTFMAISKIKIDESEKSKIEIEKLLEQSEKDRKRMQELIDKAEEARKELEDRRKNIIVILSEKLAMNNIKFEYDSEKGTVTIAQDILFLIKKSDLNIEGKEFIQLFAKILDDNIFNSYEYKDLIKYIHIEGYASREGSDEYNFKLSYQRAKNVWKYMTNSDIKNRYIMRRKLNIVSRGEIEANQNYANKNDRKVVFRFEFYDTYDKIFEGLSK